MLIQVATVMAKVESRDVAAISQREVTSFPTPRHITTVER